jgi:cytochrome c oxidase assembly factor CtaG/cytochrome oxidase Cu insertion factor (SCO1/SenC/PrrC family)
VLLAVLVSALGLLVAGCSGSSGGPSAPGQQVGTRLDGPVSEDVASLPLVDQDGHPTSLAHYAGKVVVISDIMTLCQETCPLNTTNLVAAAWAASQTKAGDQVQFLTITVDPRRDTPARLSAYRAMYAAANQLPNWDLLTGTPANVTKLWKYFGVFWRKVPATSPTPHDWLTGKPLTYDIQHADEVIFLDQHQHERFLFSGVARVGPASMIPARLRSFLSDEAQHNVAHPGMETWTVPQVLQTVGWLVGQAIPSSTSSDAMSSGDMTHMNHGSAMGGMGMATGPLDWHTAFTSWELILVWDLVILVLAAAYLVGLLRARRRGNSEVAWYRALAFYLGLAILVVSLNSSIEAYGHVLFWVHMVQHLLLIMVVPALVVAGSPLTLIRAATEGSAHESVRAALRGPAVSFVTHPLCGLALYTIVIVGTHLTSFMQLMLTHMWVHQAEHALYLVAGYIFLLPLLGNEPIRWRLPYLARIGLLFLAMAPDTVVGLVLLQTNHELFPAYADMHRVWGPSLVDDIQSGGGIMWVFGDGLMMVFILGVVWAYLGNREHNATAGSWLESVRRSAMAGAIARSGGDSTVEASLDLDNDEAALASYNEMLRRLNQRGDGSGRG